MPLTIHLPLFSSVGEKRWGEAASVWLTNRRNIEALSLSSLGEVIIKNVDNCTCVRNPEWEWPQKVTNKPTAEKWKKRSTKKFSSGAGMMQRASPEKECRLTVRPSHTGGMTNKQHEKVKYSPLNISHHTSAAMPFYWQIRHWFKNICASSFFRDKDGFKINQWFRYCPPHLLWTRRPA